MECPVCYNPYDTYESSHLPKVLARCGHSLCSRCLRILVEGPSVDNDDVFNGGTGEQPAWHPPPYARVTCPSCRQEMLVREIRTNFALLAAIERAPARDNPSANLAMCNLHDGQPCSMFCKQLGRFVCPECCEGSSAHAEAEHVKDDVIIDAVADDVRSNLSGRCLLVKQQCSLTRDELARRLETYTSNLSTIHQRILSTSERLIQEIQQQVREAEQELHMRHALFEHRASEVETRLKIVERQAEEAMSHLELTLEKLTKRGPRSVGEATESLNADIRDSVEWYCRHRGGIVSLDPSEAIRHASSDEHGHAIRATDFNDTAVEEMLAAKCDSLNLTPTRGRAGEQRQTSSSFSQQNASPSNRLLRLLRPPLDPLPVILPMDEGHHALDAFHIPQLFILEEQHEQLLPSARGQDDDLEGLRIGGLHL